MKLRGSGGGSTQELRGVVLRFGDTFEISVVIEGLRGCFHNGALGHASSLAFPAGFRQSPPPTATMNLLTFTARLVVN
jgi:hypothetical protein